MVLRYALTIACCLIIALGTSSGREVLKSPRSNDPNSDENEVIPRQASNFRKAKELTETSNENSAPETETLHMNPESVYVIRDMSSQGRQDLFGPFFAPLNFLLPPRNTEEVSDNKNEEEKSDDSDVAIPAQSSPAGSSGSIGSLISQIQSFELPSLASFLGRTPETSAVPGDKAAENAHPATESNNSEKVNSENASSGENTPAKGSNAAKDVQKEQVAVPATPANSAEANSNANSESNSAEQQTESIEDNNKLQAVSDLAALHNIKNIYAILSPNSAGTNANQNKFIPGATVLASLEKPFASLLKPLGFNVQFTVSKGNITTPDDKYTPPGQPICDKICGGSGTLVGAKCYCNCLVPECLEDPRPEPLCWPEANECACQDYCSHAYADVGFPASEGPAGQCVNGFCVCKCGICDSHQVQLPAGSRTVRYGCARSQTSS